MPRYRVMLTQQVSEEATFIIEAETEDEAEAFAEAKADEAKWFATDITSTETIVEEDD